MADRCKYWLKEHGRKLAEKHAAQLNEYENASSCPQEVYDALAEETDACIDEAWDNYWYWLERLVKK